MSTRCADGRQRMTPIEAYQRHVLGGETMASLAREAGVHKSTVMRQIRRVEDQRAEDAILDTALDAPEVLDTSALLARLHEPGVEVLIAVAQPVAVLMLDGVRIGTCRAAEVLGLLRLGALQRTRQVGRLSVYAATSRPRPRGRAGLRRVVSRTHPDWELQRTREADDAWLVQTFGQETAGFLRAVCSQGAKFEDEERRLRWPARSAKLVLRLAMDRLSHR